MVGLAGGRGEGGAWKGGVSRVFFRRVKGGISRCYRFFKGSLY